MCVKKKLKEKLQKSTGGQPKPRCPFKAQLKERLTKACAKQS
jgi:hypothetical protein